MFSPLFAVALLLNDQDSSEWMLEPPALLLFTTPIHLSEAFTTHLLILFSLSHTPSHLDNKHLEQCTENWEPACPAYIVSAASSDNATLVSVQPLGPFSY